jgi:tetratricopeptide (TPR) repeat protein
LDGLDSEVEFEAPTDEAVPSLEIEPTSLGEEPAAVEEEPKPVEAELEIVEAEPEVLEAEPEEAEEAPEAVEAELQLVEEEPPAIEAEPEVVEAVPAEAEEEPETVEAELEVIEEPKPAEEEPVAAEGEFSIDVGEPAAVSAEDSLDLEVPDLDLDSLDGEVAELDSGSIEIGEVPDLDLDEELTLDEAPGEQAVTEPTGEPEPIVVDLTEEAAEPEPVAATLDVPTLEGMVADDPENADLHRSLAEALLEAGSRDQGLEELEIVLKMYESAEAWRDADSVVAEILRLEPNSVRHHQKRVELSFHRGDKTGLANAYLGLADALLREGATDRARAVYQRVLEHDPDNERAQMGIETLAPEEEAVPEEAAPEAAAPAADKGDFVDLGSLILEDDDMRAMDTRMRIDEEEPTGDEEKDFQEMLGEFKRGIEANISEEDWQAHYDLGVAFKEMGLLDEAIGEFQKALRSPVGRLKTAESLGTCFFEKGQHSVAATVLRRAVESEAGSDDAKIGLLYWLGRAEEAVGKKSEALTHYQRVFAVDIGFEDISERVQELAE